MNIFCVDASKMLKISRLGFSCFKTPYIHFERKTEDYILYAVTSGRLRMHCDQEDIELRPGDIRIFNKGCLQSGSLPCICEFYYMHFDSEGIEISEMSEAEKRKQVAIKTFPQ